MADLTPAIRDVYNFVREKHPKEVTQFLQMGNTLSMDLAPHFKFASVCQMFGKQKQGREQKENHLYTIMAKAIRFWIVQTQVPPSPGGSIEEGIASAEASPDDYEKVLEAYDKKWAEVRKQVVKSVLEQRRAALRSLLSKKHIDALKNQITQKTSDTHKNEMLKSTQNRHDYWCRSHFQKLRVSQVYEMDENVDQVQPYATQSLPSLAFQLPLHPPPVRLETNTNRGYNRPDLGSILTPILDDDAPMTPKKRRRDTTDGLSTISLPDSIKEDGLPMQETESERLLKQAWQFLNEHCGNDLKFLMLLLPFSECMTDVERIKRTLEIGMKQSACARARNVALHLVNWAVDVVGASDEICVSTDDIEREVSESCSTIYNGDKNSAFQSIIERHAVNEEEAKTSGFHQRAQLINKYLVECHTLRLEEKMNAVKVQVKLNAKCRMYKEFCERRDTPNNAFGQTATWDGELDPFSEPAIIHNEALYPANYDAWFMRGQN